MLTLKRLQLGSILLQLGSVSQDQLDQALSEQRRKNNTKRLGEILVEMRMISEQSLLVALSKQLECPIVDLGSNPPSEDALRIISSELFYTVQEASDLLSIGRSTMYAKLKSGEITAVYPTSSARIPATAIMRYANNLESEERRHRSRTKAGQNPCKIRGNSDASQKEGVQ